MANEMTLPRSLNTDNVKARFENLLGKNAANFISSILAIYNGNEKLRQCDPMSILAAAGQAAGFKLSINPQLGYAYVIPYYDYKSRKNVAQFQIGYKGLIQLAVRNGLYRTLNSTEIYEGQIKRANPITGEFEIGDRTSDKIVGYAAYMELINGFTKTLYMSKEDVQRHAMTFSESYRNEQSRDFSVWAKNFDTMAKKTVLKKMLSMYAPLSIDMQEGALATALNADQSPKFADNPQDTKIDDDSEFETIDIETGEIVSNSEKRKNLNQL